MKTKRGYNRKRQPGAASAQGGVRGVLFYTAATILALILILLTIMFFVRSRRSFYSYTAEPEDILRSLNRGGYVEAWSDARMNRMQGVTEEEDPEYVLPYAITDYYEARSYYTAYEKAGETEKAGDALRRMDEAYEKMGELKFMADEIDDMFERASE